jgi:hypothetical protein
MILMWAPVAFTGEFLLSTRRSPESHAWRYLDRTVLVPTMERAEFAFFRL